MVADGILNKATLVSEVIKGMTTSMVNVDVAGNAPGKSSYANVTGKPSGKKLNMHTLFTPRGNGIDVVVSVESIRAISDRFANLTYGFFLGHRVAYPVVTNYVKNTWEDVSIVPVWVKLHGVPVTAFNDDSLSVIATKLGTPLMLDVTPSNLSTQRNWKPPKCASCKVFRHIHEECLKNTCAGEKKTANKPSQTSRGIPVGLKIGFKPQKEYIPVFKKPIGSSSRNKKKGVGPTIEVSNSNLFEVLNSVDDDVEFGTNANLENNEATTSGSSFMNCDNCNTGTTPVLEKIRMFEELLTSFDTQSLREQWRDSYGNGDYNVDPYDDDKYEGHDLTQELQAICDNLDIRV
ncbi:retrotransposon protein, putative, ty1-copia subclass [Tanacetum coccineum]